MRKKIIAVLLACMMAASVVPMSVSANGGDEGGTGSTTVTVVDGVCEVGTESELKSAITEANKQESNITTIRLTANFSVTGAVENNQALLAITKDNVVFDGNNHTLTVDCGNSQANFLGINGCSGVTVKNLTITKATNGQVKHGINVYKSTGVKISDFTATDMNGLGLLVNISEVTVSESIDVSNNGWGNKINVGWGDNASGQTCGLTADATADLHGAFVYTDSNDVENATQEGNFSISVPGYVKLSDPENVGAVNAYFSPSSVPVTVTGTTDTTYYASFAKAVEAASEGATVTLNKDVTVDNVIKLNNKITLNGGGHSITAGEGVSDNFVTVLKDGTELKNVKLVAGTASKNVLHIYKAKDVALTGVTLDHSKAADGAPMIVNASDVTVAGQLELITGEKSWYGINVDGKGTTATLTFNDGSEVVFNDDEGRSLIKSEGEGTKKVNDNAEVLAARVGDNNGVSYFYSTLQDAVDAVEADKVPNVSTETITVLRSSETATVKNIQELSFAVADTVTELPQLKDTTTGKTYQVSANGETVEVEDPGTEIPDEETYTVTVDNKVWGEYEEGEKVEIYTAPYTYDGRFFVRWVGDVNFYDAYSNSTTFKMPAKDVDVYTYYTYINYTPVEPDVPDYTPVKPVEPDEPEIEWIQKDGNTYLYIDDEMITGWYQDEETEKWYWFDEETGVISDDCWEKIDGVWYLFDEDGIMLTGWQKVDGKWYYLKPWGGMATGWQLIDSVWYYLRGDGSMAANAWVQSGGYWYYLTGSGEMATNKWVEWKGDWYYLYSSGIMATNATIDGYYVDSNGIWQA